MQINITGTDHALSVPRAKHAAALALLNDIERRIAQTKLNKIADALTEHNKLVSEYNTVWTEYAKLTGTAKKSAKKPVAPPPFDLSAADLTAEERNLLIADAIDKAAFGDRSASEYVVTMPDSFDRWLGAISPKMIAQWRRNAATKIYVRLADENGVVSKIVKIHKFDGRGDESGKEKWPRLCGMFMRPIQRGDKDLAAAFGAKTPLDLFMGRDPFTGTHYGEIANHGEGIMMDVDPADPASLAHARDILTAAA